MSHSIDLNRVTHRTMLRALTELEWKAIARPEQRTPPGDWRIWLILAGRGWGKTRTGAQDVAIYGLRHPGHRIAIVAPTMADARDTCVEGDSGLLHILPPGEIKAWNRSMGELILMNGTRYKLFSADEPERLRGPQHHRAWCDELCAWVRPDALDQLTLGLRLGDDPRTIITTTPKPLPLIKQLVARANKPNDVILTRGSTYDNADNLAASALKQFEDRYGGTRLGRQELEAEILDDSEGALWQRGTLDRQRVAAAPPLDRIVVALDPAMTAHDGSDETGIICAGIAADGQAYVLADASGKYSPEGWAQAALALAHQYGAASIVGEVNAGGDLIARVLQTTGNTLPFRRVYAVAGKVGRALPVAALYEQGRVRHVGAFNKLEDQMCRFTLGAFRPGSPDRVDALVWALTDLLLTSPAKPGIKFI